MPELLEYFRLYVGQRIDPAKAIERLIQFGYKRVDQVADPGDMAVRGGILDIFPTTFESPIRVEMISQRVGSIRSFNPATFETLDRHSIVVILPNRLRMRLSSMRTSQQLGDTDDFSTQLLVPFEEAMDLEEGDAVVHIEHGIGRFLNRTTIETSEGEKDALVLEYADGDRLYVPMDQIHLVHKYVGFGSKSPVVHKLGGKAWQNAKTRAYTGAWMYARDLLSIQAKRMSLPGFSFSKDHQWQKSFEDAFPYRQTPDQLKSSNDVKNDMESNRPMDRLLLGDVGYGKTEVALRAAFKSVMDHKQVAVLVPTTILAYQHYRTFTNRMKSFPIQVEMLSRFQSETAQRSIIKSLKSGSCDVVIGTHRLLSSDIGFKDLGLLIIDEEQRFGLKDKEKIKHMKSQLDVLVLSATPIPRTLYLALMGSRQISLIATPPENRHPVATAVAEEDDDSLKRWIERELERRGQVYVVNNRVKGISRLASRISALVPDARVGIGHGQMREDELESTIVNFIEGEIDVLVSTTIIESGMDIPNANTLIVISADKFGLADLYQLRGRVGRFTRKAYAYFLVPKEAVLSREARERLRSIIEHTSLGSGFKIAMEDLKLRGAGNLLGVEQHGHITAVGFDLYCRLLREAVDHLSGERVSPREVG